MCGRAYQTYTEDELFFRYLNEKYKRPSFKVSATYNLAPTQLSPVVLIENSEVTLSPMRWGLIPLWAKDVQSASKYSLINARGEEILEKKSYKEPFEKRRCIVPFSGFYEWHRESEKVKTPYAIHLKDKKIMSVAGVWEKWKNPIQVEVIHSFSIITIASNSFMSKIHDRMPVILDQNEVAQWLDPKNNKTQSLLKLLKPCPNEWMDAYPISSLVNSPKNNRPELLSKV